jgi:hypothetical protein
MHGQQPTEPSWTLTTRVSISAPHCGQFTRADSHRPNQRFARFDPDPVEGQGHSQREGSYEATTFLRATRKFGSGQRQAVKSFLAIREYDYLSASVSFCGTPESLTGLTQPVASIDDWRDLSRRH